MTPTHVLLVSGDATLASTFTRLVKITTVTTLDDAALATLGRMPAGARAVVLDPADASECRAWLRRLPRVPAVVTPPVAGTLDPEDAGGRVVLMKRARSRTAFRRALLTACFPGADAYRGPLLAERRTRPHAPDRTDGDPSSASPAGEASPPPVPAQTEGSDRRQAAGSRTPGPWTLVAALTQRAGELYSVAEVAQALAEQAVDELGATATAVLVDDGALWRPLGAVGLTPTERHFEVAAGHWLLGVTRGSRAVVVEHSDIVRRQLQGTPLASREHLLVVPVPGTSAILLAARDADPSFGDQHVDAAHALVAQSRPLLENATAVRALARALADLTR